MKPSASTSEPLKVTPAQPLLANSSPEILKPIEIPAGTLQVVWIEQIDAHGLLFANDKGTQLLATHNNGHSCHALATRMKEGNRSRAIEQLYYIQNCGGTIRDEEVIRYIMHPLAGVLMSDLQKTKGEKNDESNSQDAQSGGGH